MRGLKVKCPILGTKPNLKQAKIRSGRKDGRNHNQYKDDIKCIVPKHFDTSTMSSYGPQACWINGFYVYEQLRHKEKFEGYYGLPINLEHNGINRNGKTCAVSPENENTDCKPMEKMFYLQYQWFPFYFALLAVLYYIPYIIFGWVNNDLITLRKTIKSQKVEIEEIVSSYFGTERTNRNNLRIVLNVVVKLAYLFVNVLVFLTTDSVLNGEFKQFGKKWIKWSELNNTAAHNYLNIRDHLKPGEVLLPTFGFCDVLELGKDIKHEHQLLCEISQHVFYHYVLIGIWFAIVVGMVVSVIGIIALFVRMFFRSYLFANDHLSLRQWEYLDFIRKKNVPIYGELIRELFKDKFGSDDDAGVSSGEVEETAH